MLSVANSSSAVITFQDQERLPVVSRELFDSVDIRLGTAIDVKINSKVRVPSFRLVMDFGSGFEDLKQSSAQLQDNYYCGRDEIVENAADGRAKSMLTGQQIAAVTNFPKRSVGIPSFFLTLGVVSLTDEQTGTVVLKPLIPCTNGVQVQLLNNPHSWQIAPRKRQVEYADTFHHLDIRLGTVVDVVEKIVDFGQELGLFRYRGDYPLVTNGVQLLRVTNLGEIIEEDNFLGVVNERNEKIPLTVERTLPNGRFLK